APLVEAVAWRSFPAAEVCSAAGQSTDLGLGRERRPEWQPLKRQGRRKPGEIGISCLELDVAPQKSRSRISITQTCRPRRHLLHGPDVLQEPVYRNALHRGQFCFDTKCGGC